MPARFFLAVVTLILGTTAPSVARDAIEGAAPSSNPYEIIVKFADDAHADLRLQRLASFGATHVTPLGRTGALLLRLSEPKAPEIIARYGDEASLSYIEPNFVYKAALVPNDTWFTQQWALLNTGQSGGTPGADIRATAAWDLATGSPPIVIGFIDSGIDLTHPDLAGNLYVNSSEIPNNGIDDDNNGFIDDVHGWDFVANDNDPQDDNGHGTLGAGIAGAVANNGMGMAGVAWHVSLLPIKFLDATGSGTTANAIRALDYAVTMGVPITNNSWGGGGFSQALLDAILAAHDAGIVFVASAGGGSANLDDHPAFPASYDAPNVLTVAATNHDDILATSSNYGAKTVDLAAPGVDILTTHLGSTYFTMSGTSAATAHVSGALALVLSRFTGISGLHGAMHLLRHAEKVPSLAGLIVTEGRLDAYSPLVEVPTDLAESRDRPAAQPGGLRLWWSGSDQNGVRLGLALLQDERLQLHVFDIRGRRIRTLLEGPRAAGFHETVWDGFSDEGIRVASGVYVARLRSRTGSATTRVFLQP